MSKRQAIPYALLLIVFLIWFYLRPQDDVEPKDEHLPSYVAHQIENIHYDEHGAIAYKVYATKATHYSTKEITTFESPKITLYTENKQDKTKSVWQLTSEDGILEGKNKLILSTNVLVKNLTQDQLIQTMSTEKLTVLLEEKEVSSELMVNWKGPEMRQQGIGMWASLASEELIVKSKIKAIYLNETK